MKNGKLSLAEPANSLEDILRPHPPEVRIYRLHGAGSREPRGSPSALSGTPSDR